VDLYIMFAQSKSMQAPAGLGTRLDAVRAAVANFLREPNSAGLGVGLGYFGTMPIGSTSCDPADYATPAVPIGLLPPNADALIASLNGIEPVGETPTGPALVGACEYARTHQSAHPDHNVAVLLVTDGVPEAGATVEAGGTCDPILEEAIAAAVGCASGALPIPVYVLGVGSSLSNMNQIAEAGTTGSAHLVEGGDVSTEVLRALNAIRGDVLPCEYRIPEPPAGERLDYDTVNVRYKPANGEPETLFNVPSAADCGPAGGWYYDDSREHILLCEVTCTEVGTAAHGTVDYALGCQRTVTLR
jgi:hypothetical protein